MILEEFVGRNRHYNLARLIFDKGGKRKQCTVGQPSEQAEKYQKSEETRHDQTRRSRQHPAISGELRPRSGTADKTTLAVGPIAAIWTRGFATES